MDDLALFLRADAAKPFDLGRRDCALRLADWVMAKRGFDPASDIRGRYANEDELKAITGRGGVPMIIARVARRAGLRMTRHPVRGDVAVIVAIDQKPKGAIRLQAGWSIIADGGVARIPDNCARMLAAWSV